MKRKALNTTIRVALAAAFCSTPALIYIGLQRHW